jgi:hypothetical protein
VSRYQVERGDVLLSVQLILTAEEEGLRSAGRWPSANAARPAVPHTSVTRAGLAAPARTASPSARHAIPPVRRARVAPPPPLPPMVDPLTGAGTPAALRRDLSLIREAAVAGHEPAVVVLTIEGLDQVRLAIGPEAALAVLRALVEVAPFALRARDRIYRAERAEMALLLPGADPADVEAARTRLEASLSRVLAERGFPEVRLAVRPLDPLALAS